MTWSDAVAGVKAPRVNQKEKNMSTLSPQRRQRPLFPEIADLLAGLPSWAHLRPGFEGNIMRLEDEMKDGTYEVRAELPGIDPAKDVDITVGDGRLTIKAERTEKKESNGRSEFSYGSRRGGGAP